MKEKTVFIRSAIYIGAGLTFSLLLYIVLDLLIKGVPHLRPEMFELKYNSTNLSMMPAIVNTVIMVFLALAMAGPVGIISAVYLTEYADIKSPLVKPVRITAQTLSGIPSIVYGLFGTLFFVTALNWKYSILAGACTIAMMILPLIMNSTEQALLAVPNSLREASFGLGAMNLRTVFKIVIPSAMPGILAGVVLAVGRIVAETAALIFTAGTSPKVPRDLFSSGRTMATHMYILSGEGMHKDQAYAAGVVLLLVVIIINELSEGLARRMGW